MTTTELTEAVTRAMRMQSEDALSAFHALLERQANARHGLYCIALCPVTGTLYFLIK